ncbi:MAG: hypothetical protein II715_00855, partial [Clostridia bacterium]|nr:hypothetical protein [Clostridia bacterium]
AALRSTPFFSCSAAKYCSYTLIVTAVPPNVLILVHRAPVSRSDVTRSLMLNFLIQDHYNIPGRNQQEKTALAVNFADPASGAV